MSHPLFAYPAPDPERSPMSPRNPLDRAGRGRSAAAHRRAHVSAADTDAFRRSWSLLMVASFPSREACAVEFGVSFQTACNWFEGAVSPYGHQVARAARELPRFDEIIGGRA